MRFAVVGNPIDHSLSPLIHQYFATQTQIHLTYEKMKVQASSFEEQVSNFFIQGGKGLNITSPFKQNAYRMAATHSSRCQRAGSANTLWMKGGLLQADNTDGVGLIRDISRYIDLTEKRVLILGAGGAARGIIYPLLENKVADLVVANRTLVEIPQIQCVRIQEISGVFDLIINATSIRTIEEFAALPTPCFSEQPFCYDLSYKEEKITPFVQYANRLDCPAMDGLGMLVEQAAESFFIWHGIKPETQGYFSSKKISNCFGIRNRILKS
jgi:shikimate dehydrogenase